MQHRRVRTDEFETDSKFLRVTGRQGYEQSTDVWIERETVVDFAQVGEATVDPGFNIIRADERYAKMNLTRVNLNGEVDCKISTAAVCKSLDNVLK